MHSSPMRNAEFPLIRADCIGTDHPIGQESRSISLLRAGIGV